MSMSKEQVYILWYHLNDIMQVLLSFCHMEKMQQMLVTTIP